MIARKPNPHPLVCMLLLAGAAPARAEMPDRLIEALPPEPMAVWLLERHARAEKSDAANVASIAALLLQRGREMGLLPKLGGAAGWASEGLTILPDLAPYPRALVLLDVGADALPDGGHRLAGIQAGLLLLTGGENQLIERRIQAVLNLHTDSSHSRLETREADGLTRHRLVDDRLPQWAPFEWGAVRDFYLVTVGPGAWQRMAAALSDPESGLARDPWFCAAHQRSRGPGARWEWYVDVERLRRRLAPVMPEKIGEVLDGLRLNEVSRGVWTVGPDGRAVDAACVLRLNGRDHYIPITVSGEEARAFDAVIPPQASSAAIIRGRPSDLVERGRNAYLSAKSPGERRRLRRAWSELEAELGVQTQTEILDQLGDHVIIHDYPPHPLRLPLFRTVLVEIGGSSQTVRGAFDRLLGRAQAELRELSARGVPVLSALQLQHDADGVWYLQLGIYGPALAVTDRWIIISHSPQAVRQNVQYLGDAPATSAPASNGP